MPLSLDHYLHVCKSTLQYVANRLWELLRSFGLDVLNHPVDRFSYHPT